MQHQRHQPAYQYNYTVHTFLQAAGTSRTRKHHHHPDYQWDHVVELQLVVAAVNRLTTDAYQNRIDGEWQKELAHFFKQEENFQEITAAQNEAKGQAVTRRIRNTRPQPGDDRWLNMVGQKWHNMRQSLILAQRHGRFVNEMNKLIFK